MEHNEEINPSEINLEGVGDTIFTFKGDKYYLDQDISEIKQEIVYEMGKLTDELIDHSVYEGSPYRLFKRAATSEDVTKNQVLKYIARNRDKWKTEP